MSLYDDVLTTDSSESDGWAQSSGRRLLAQHLQNRQTKASQSKAKPNPRREPSKKTIANPSVAAHPPLACAADKASLLGGEWAVDREYDPIWPNDYEKTRRERRSRDSRPKEAKERPKRLPDDKRAGAAIAPPPSLCVDPTGASVAAKIMARMGYKEGQGLGREEQGMSSALSVEKTSKRGGKIVAETPAEVPTESPVESITEIMKTPSKVVLLRNMVASGEVDELLEDETKEECGKYGDVGRVVIFEAKEAEFPVRIFVEFRRVEAAIKAVVDLNGRYFGGRVVRANFYDLEKFKKLDLNSQ